MTQVQPFWQAVFFDFDGVIADSTDIKVRAFAELFAEHGPAVQEAVVRFHMDNGGMPRHLKLRHCCERIAGIAVDADLLDRLGQRFAGMVFAGVIAAPLMPGVMQTLRQLEREQIPAVVVSATPHVEMNRVAERKGLRGYFLEVHGSPRSKTEIVADVLRRFDCTPRRCLFVGDALADLRAARETGLHFLGIVPFGKASLFPDGTTISSTVLLPAAPAPGLPGDPGRP